MTRPGRAKPCSGRTWWQMPALMSKKLGIALLGDELADGLVVLGVLLVGGRDDVVEDDDDLPGRLDLLDAELAELLDDGRGVVVGQDVVRRDGDDLAGPDVLAGLAAEDLFRQRFAHDRPPGLPILWAAGGLVNAQGDTYPRYMSPLRYSSQTLMTAPSSSISMRAMGPAFFSSLQRALRSTSHAVPVVDLEMTGVVAAQDELDQGDGQGQLDLGVARLAVRDQDLEPADLAALDIFRVGALLDGRLDDLEVVAVGGDGGGGQDADARTGPG